MFWNGSKDNQRTIYHIQQKQFLLHNKIIMHLPQCVKRSQSSGRWCCYVMELFVVLLTWKCPKCPKISKIPKIPSSPQIKGAWYENHDSRTLHSKFLSVKHSPAQHQKSISETFVWNGYLVAKWEFLIFGHYQRDKFFI